MNRQRAGYRRDGRRNEGMKKYHGISIRRRTESSHARAPLTNMQKASNVETIWNQNLKKYTMNAHHDSRALLDYMSPRAIFQELWEATRFYLKEKKASSALAIVLIFCLLAYAIAIYIAAGGRFSENAVHAATIFGIIIASLFVSITNRTEENKEPVKRFSQGITLLQGSGLLFSIAFLWIWVNASAELIETGRVTYVMPKQLFFAYIALLVIMIITACVAYPRDVQTPLTPPSDEAQPQTKPRIDYKGPY